MKYLAIHHTAVKRTSTPQLNGVNRYHRNKNWGTYENPWFQKQPSSLGWWVGYNEFVDVDGKRTKTRIATEETIAVRGHNCDVPERCDAYSVCFALDGDIQLFNEKQKLSFLNIKNEHTDKELILHRNLQEDRTCPGERISLKYLQGLGEETEDEIKRRLIKQQISLLDILVGLYRKLINLKS